MLVAIMSRAIEESRATNTTKLRIVQSSMPLKITHSNRIFLDAFFYMKKEYMDYFYDMG